MAGGLPNSRVPYPGHVPYNLFTLVIHRELEGVHENGEDDLCQETVSIKTRGKIQKSDTHSSRVGRT